MIFEAIVGIVIGLLAWLLSLLPNYNPYAGLLSVIPNWLQIAFASFVSGVSLSWAAGLAFYAFSRVRGASR